MLADAIGAFKVDDVQTWNDLGDADAGSGAANGASAFVEKTNLQVGYG